MLSSAVLWQLFPVFCLAVRTLFCIVWGVFPVFYPLCIRECLVHWSNRKVRIRYHQRSFLWNPTLRCIPGCTFGLACFIGYLLTGSVVFCAAVSDFLTLLCPMLSCACCLRVQSALCTTRELLSQHAAAALVSCQSVALLPSPFTLILTLLLEDRQGGGG